MWYDRTRGLKKFEKNTMFHINARNNKNKNIMWTGYRPHTLIYLI